MDILDEVQEFIDEHVTKILIYVTATSVIGGVIADYSGFTNIGGEIVEISKDVAADVTRAAEKTTDYIKEKTK